MSWLVSPFPNKSPGRDRVEARLHRVTREFVTEAYREAVRNSCGDTRRAFEAAVDAYRNRYPDLSPDVAPHAVAEILASDGTDRGGGIG
ncbi:MAG TPA: hypothetical protein VGD08_14160 [Stellaceae bacterium]|jgi:hypothetical protein